MRVRHYLILALSSVAVAWVARDLSGGPAAVATTTGVFAVGMVFGIRFTRRKTAESMPSSAPIADGPPPATEAAPRLHQFVQPSTMDAESVARAFLHNAGVVGDVVAAHIWLEDAATATLRSVACQGTLAPARNPVPVQESSLGESLLQGRSVLEPLSRVIGPGDARTVWRYAGPIGTHDIRGVAAVDIAADAEPSNEQLTDVFATMRTALSGALALHVAESEHDAAKRLMKAARVLSRTLDPEGVVSECLSAAVRLAGAATGSVMLLAEDGNALEIVEAHGLPDDVVDSTVVSVGEGIAGWVAATGQPVLVEDLPGKPGRVERHGVRSAVSVPIADEDGLLGVLNVGSRRYPAHFTRSHLDTLELLGRQTAVALRNARAIQSAEDVYLSSLKALALALETKDPYSQGGTDRVMELAVHIGRAMDLDGEDLQALELAAMLHDIGMTGAGSLYAACSRPLTTIERGLVRMHPAVAAEILEQAPALKKVVPIVYHHHEHYDGSGYIAGAAGPDIPLASRILSLADAYVAMTSDRPYRRALTDTEARDEIHKKSGTQFDPAVVEVFLDLGRADRERSGRELH